MLKKREKSPGGVVPDDTFHQQLAKGRKVATASWLKADRNKWALSTFIALFIAGLAGLGWYVEHQRFAENVRVVWVKLSPDGTYNVEYADEDKPIEYFSSTVEAKLSEWVEKRYSKFRSSITTDYGFANMLMSPQLSREFVSDYKAPTVAAEHVACTDCNDIEYRVRTVEPLDKDLTPGTKKDHTFTTLIFVRERQINKDGQIGTCKNKIVTVHWQFRPKAEIVRRRDELRYNPLGMEVIRYNDRDDPTPVTTEDCIKR